MDRRDRSDRMPPGRPPRRGGEYSSFVLEPAALFQICIVVYFIFILWVEYGLWQREDEQAARENRGGGGHVDLDDDRDDF